MVNLTLLLLLLHYAAFLIFKPKSNVLGCGIFAWAGKKHTAFDRSKFDILGIMNETRGVDSCGITVDGEIYTGTGQTKVYRDFIAAEERLVPREIPVVIGHTRWSTVGAHTPANAHPFGFGSHDNGEKYAFIGVHNGTLLNHHTLAGQYGVETSVKKNGVYDRTKIDSEILLEIIYTSKNFKVLSEYNGAAALVFYNVLEPNVIYCYHGMSKKFAHEKEPSEERPLFYYKEGRNSLYISSLEESLFAIGGNADNVHPFDYNTVYKIVDGNVDKAEKFRVSRQHRTQKSNYGSSSCGVSPYSYNGYGTAYEGDDYYPYEEVGQQQLPLGKEDGKTKGKDVSGEAKEKETKVIEVGAGAVKNIYNEPLLHSANLYKGKVMFNKLRYWKNGETIEGFYTFINGFGFFELGETLKEADSRFWYYCNCFFVDGRFITNDEDLTDDEWARVSMPFVHTDKDPIKNPPIYPFYDGIRLKTVADLDACIRMEKDGRGFDPVGLSMCSEHPVIDICCKSRPDSDQRIFLNGEKFTGNIAPLGAERVYHIRNGNLITTKLRAVKPAVEEVKDLTCVVDKIADAQKEEEKKEERKTFEDFVSNDLIEKEIDQAFMGPYESFPKHKKVLEKFLPNEKAKQAIKIIDDFTAGTYKLVEIENK